MKVVFCLRLKYRNFFVFTNVMWLSVTKQELEEYLQAADRPGRIIALLRSCIKDFNFISNTTWFFGALGYCIANYHEFIGPTGTFANYVGAIGYFLGGSAYAAMFYHQKKQHLLTIVNLKHTTKRIMKMYKRELRGGCNIHQQTLARATIRRTIKAGSNDDGQLISTGDYFVRNTALGNTFQHLDANKKEELYRPSLDRLQLQMSQIGEGEEEDGNVETEFSPDNKETSPKGASKTPERMYQCPNPIEEFLSKDKNVKRILLEKVEFSSTSQVAGSLFMYHVRSDYEDKVGFLYRYPSYYNPEDSKCKIVLSSDGRKILATNFPCQTGEWNEYRKLSSTEEEGILPIKTPFGIISEPLMVTNDCSEIGGSQSGNSLLHFQLIIDEESGQEQKFC